MGGSLSVYQEAEPKEQSTDYCTGDGDARADRSGRAAQAKFSRSACRLDF